MMERVLVLPRAAIPGGAEFHGVRPADQATLEDLRHAVAAHGMYDERAHAEGDPTHKQLIPYVVVRRGRGERLRPGPDCNGPGGRPQPGGGDLG